MLSLHAILNTHNRCGTAVGCRLLAGLTKSNSMIYYLSQINFRIPEASCRQSGSTSRHRRHWDEPGRIFVLDRSPHSSWPSTTRSSDHLVSRSGTAAQPSFLYKSARYGEEESSALERQEPAPRALNTVRGYREEYPACVSVYIAPPSPPPVIDTCWESYGGLTPREYGNLTLSHEVLLPYYYGI
jgi:hypothetical protein